MAPAMSKEDVWGDTNVALMKHFWHTIWSMKRGKLSVSFIFGLIGVSTGVGIIKYISEAKAKKLRAAARKVGNEIDEKSGRRAERDKHAVHGPQGLVDQLKAILKIAFPRVFCKPSVYLVLYTILLFARIILTIKIAKVTGSLGRTVGARTFTKMFQLQVVFALWCIPATVVNSLLNFVQEHLSLEIRKNLTDDIHKKYLENLVYYRASNLGSFIIDDIDQRVTQDLKKFCSQLSELYGNLLKPILEVILMSRSLSRMMGGKYLAFFFLFFIIAGQGLRFVMPPFARLTAETQRLEGELRANHTRVNAHAEEIAFYGGGAREREILDASFQRVCKISAKTFFLRMLMDILDNYVVKYGASMVAYSMMMPAVYLGLQGLKGKSAPAIMEYYLTSTQLFVALGTACKHLVLSYKRVQALSGLTMRISELFEMLKRRAGGFDGKEDVEEMKALALRSPHRTNIIEPAEILQGGHTIVFEHADLFSPTGKLLVKDLCFEVKENTNVLVSGPNGSGKSSLFRVLGGLWPLCGGRLTKPSQDKLFYIPQQPYLAPGSLQDQVTYPLSIKNMSAAERARLDDLMKIVNLDYLVPREGGWEVVREWADVLSGGEKQRLAMARLFYHRPAFGILDECTSAVSMDVEGKLYATCKDLGITIFTVSHRKGLRHHHDYELQLDGQKGWAWFKVNPDGTIDAIHKPEHFHDIFN